MFNLNNIQFYSMLVSLERGVGGETFHTFTFVSLSIQPVALSKKCTGKLFFLSTKSNTTIKLTSITTNYKKATGTSLTNEKLSLWSPLTVNFKE